MTKFKQKNYNILTLGNALLGGSLIQGQIANNEAENQTEEMERHNRKMEKIAQQEAEAQKSFGIISPTLAKDILGKVKSSNLVKTVKNAADSSGVSGFAKDILGKEGIGIGDKFKKAAGFGAGMAGVTYAGNRVAQSWKDHDEGKDGETGKALAKIAGTTALIGGGLYAAKKAGYGGALNTVKKAINPIVKDAKTGAIDKKSTGIKLALNGSFAAMPVLGYASQRNQQKEQTEYQSNYSDEDGNSGLGGKILKGLTAAGIVAGGLYGAKKGVFGNTAQKIIGNTMATSGSYLNRFKATKGLSNNLINSGSNAYGQAKAAQMAGKLGVKDSNTIKDVASNISATRKKLALDAPASISNGASDIAGRALNFGGFLGTKSGSAAVQRTADKLANSENSISKAVGEHMKKHKKLANLEAGGAAFLGGTMAIGAGDKAVKAVTKTIDNRAYDIEKEQDQKVYSKIVFKDKGVKKDPRTGELIKFKKKETIVNSPSFKSKSISITEKSFTKWDQTDQLKGMTDADILAEKKKPTSSLSLGKSTLGALGGSVVGGALGKTLGKTSTGALAGAAIGGMAGMDKQTRDKTMIGTGLGAAAGLGLGLLTKKPNLYKSVRNGALLGGTAGVIAGVKSGHKENKENQFFNDRLEYAQGKALKREKTDWKNNMNNREGYSR